MNPELSEVEVRVLGALLEKETTTPEYYPLSLNALVNACNQKSNRHPVMNLDENAVRGAVRALTERAMVRSASGDSRVASARIGGAMRTAVARAADARGVAYARGADVCV
jgi:uncharacterized protein YceH (UPF0502 family)